MDRKEQIMENFKDLSNLHIEAHVRKAIPDDAKEVADVLNSVIREGKYTAFTRVFSIEEERTFISSLGERNAMLVAEINNKIVGIQVIDLLLNYMDSMKHVATMGTWILADFRGYKIGHILAEESFEFARRQRYKKVVIQVLAHNERALRFYGHLGFEKIGIAGKQVEFNGEFYDSVYLEKFL